MSTSPKLRAVAAAMFLASFALILFELLLTRLFGVVLFAQFAHLALALALLGIGIGAVMQHLFPSLVPDEGLEDRLAWILVIQGMVTLLAVLCTLHFPLVAQNDETFLEYAERSAIKDELIDLGWFAALLPFITLPFVLGGLAFAGVFQRRRADIGILYGADLIGGAVGAVVFIPLLGLLAGADLVFVILAATALGAHLLWLTHGGRKVGTASTLAALVIAVGLTVYGALGNDVFRVRYAAGTTEELVTYSEWTPLARLAIQEAGENGTFMLLDNTSASEIFLDEKRLEATASLANRSLVYHLQKPPGRVAILAASAGPEVVVAQRYGFQDIDAIDIAGEIFGIVARRFPDSPYNPYLSPRVGQVKSDGRAAILHAREDYDLIQMVHANLWSSAGLISNAWSPALLETKEAFETYLDKLTPDGTLSFGRGASTDQIVRSAAAALAGRGVTEPWRHLFYVTGSSTVVLVKPRPFTQEERDVLAAARQTKFPRTTLTIDPMQEPDKATKKRLFRGPVMTDDRPYLDDLRTLRLELDAGLRRATDAEKGPIAVLYRSILVQVSFVLGAGILFLGLPFLRRGPAEIQGVPGIGWVLGYVGCLGYGYLAVETILVHELVLFVGHPTYAVTIVILAMLLSSGVGSTLSGRIAPDRRLRVLQGVLVAAIVLGTVQAFVVPSLLKALFLGQPVWLRMGITLVVLTPLGFLMGLPFPIAMSMLPARAGGVVPWAWALNGWMSVVASLVTVVISRLFGYSYAFGLALAAYALAMLLAPRLVASRRDVAVEGPPGQMAL